MKSISKLPSMTLLLALASVLMCSACSSMIQPVQAWEKAKLAKKEMTFDGDALENKYAEHIYTSKESSFGGNGVGGGGCGCN